MMPRRSQLGLAAAIFAALALFSFLAAVYLTVEASGDRPLQEDFRRRALAAAAALGLLSGP